MTLYLLDKSATAARLNQGDKLRSLIVTGRVAVCHMTALEMLFSAVSPAQYEVMRDQLAAYLWLDTTEACMERALAVQRLLAATGRHRVPIPDLVIAATAEQHRATVLHMDKDFELIAEVTGQAVERI